ncbi:MAG: hypothetical protein ACJA0Q_002160 [Saprospiraceae bacterium]|jgi:uncharacterized protein YndB with AHSA1/START domain
MVQFQIEYPVKSSVSILYKAFATPSGLSEWFCDDVNLERGGKVFVFKWEDSEQRAEILDQSDNSHIKFRWLEDEGEDVFFELRIQVDGITGDVALVITDHCDDDEVEESKLLWVSQAKELAHNIGG